MRITQKYLSTLSQPLIGIDEVGRGCLAGPVYAAAVIFKSTKDVKKYQDSKATSELDRKLLSDSICEHHYYGIGIASVEEVDQFNIRQATFIAMKRAIEELEKRASTEVHNLATLLVDGRDQIPKLERFNQLAIIGGDAKVRLISAASIVAKVARDEFMSQLPSEYMAYGFEKHKGYGTEFHRKQIQKFGPTALHRQTFSGVKEYISSHR